MLIQSCVFRPCICFLVLGSTNGDGTGTIFSWIFSSDLVSNPMLSCECFWRIEKIANYAEYNTLVGTAVGVDTAARPALHGTHVPTTIVRTTSRIATVERSQL